MRKKEWWFAPRGTWNCVIQLMRPEKGIIPVPIRQETVIFVKIFIGTENFNSNAVGIQTTRLLRIVANIFHHPIFVKNINKNFAILKIRIYTLF